MISRSSRITRRSAILVGASQHRRADESLVPQCAWCGKVRVGGHWTLPEELPDFLADHLENRHTHGICPDCFAAVERDAGAAAPLGRSSVLVRTDGPLAIECLFRALRGYQIGIAHIADAAALALQPFGVGDGVLAGHGRGVGLAHGEGLRVGPAMVHPAIAEQVAGVIDDGNGYGTVGRLDGLVQHSIHGPAGLVQAEQRFLVHSTTSSSVSHRCGSSCRPS